MLVSVPMCPEAAAAARTIVFGEAFVPDLSAARNLFMMSFFGALMPEAMGRTRRCRCPCSFALCSDSSP